jgi:hypothetical protein
MKDRFVYDPTDPAEKGDVVLEQNYFQANPTEGQFSYQVILGDAEDPSLYRILFLFFCTSKLIL